MAAAGHRGVGIGDRHIGQRHVASVVNSKAVVDDIAGIDQRVAVHVGDRVTRP